MIDVALLTTVNESNLNFPQIVKYKGMEAAWLAPKVFLLLYIYICYCILPLCKMLKGIYSDC